MRVVFEVCEMCSFVLSLFSLTWKFRFFVKKGLAFRSFCHSLSSAPLLMEDLTVPEMSGIIATERCGATRLTWSDVAETSRAPLRVRVLGSH